MRRVLATMTCLGAVITVDGCGGGSTPQSRQSGVGTAPGTPGSATATATTATPTPAAKTANPPTVFDAAAGVPLPTGAFSTNIGGSIITRFLTLRVRTAYIVARNR